MKIQVKNIHLNYRDTVSKGCDKQYFQYKDDSSSNYGTLGFFIRYISKTFV